jgi:hypothetical protein
MGQPASSAAYPIALDHGHGTPQLDRDILLQRRAGWLDLITRVVHTGCGRKHIPSGTAVLSEQISGPILPLEDSARFGTDGRLDRYWMSNGRRCIPPDHCRWSRSPATG